MKLLRLIISQARIFTLLVILLPIVAGTYAYKTLPKEGEPEISAPIALVFTVYPGASPGEMESLVTNPIEEELSDLKNVEEMRSSSAEGLSVVVIEFDVDADIERSLQKVREKVTDARSDLPVEAEDPVVEEISLSDIPILLVSIVGDLDPIKLKKLAEDASDEIELAPEVLSTEVAGGLTREIQIFADPDRLNQYGLTILDVYAAVKAADVNIPGGMVDVDRRRFLLRTLTEIKRVEDYAMVPLIQAGDQVVYLKDVARIVDGHSEELTYAHVEGKSAVTISVKKRAGANILETSEKVRAKVKELEKGFPYGTTAVITADQAKFINQGFEIMNNSAVTGLIIVVIVLYFAMGLRNSFITAMSIPLSLLMTFIFLKIFGLTNNNMVRFSLVLCIGLLVDNAIIVVENAYHHYQLGKDRLTSVIDGVSEIAMPVIAATLTTMAAFLPVLLMTGTTGEYMGFLPKTVTMALTSSLIVALVANPLVLSRFMKRSVKGGRIVSPEEDLARLKRLYVYFVKAALNHRLLVICITVISLVWAGGLIAFKVVEIEMFPDIDFDYIYITIETPPGTEVEETRNVTRQVERIIRENVPEAVRTVATVGYKGKSAFELSVGEGADTAFSEVTVELLDGKEYARATHKEIQKRIQPFLDEIPGAIIRYRPLAWGPPRFAPIVLNVIGPDLDVLRGITADVKRILSNIRGATDVKDDFSDAPPELRVEIDRAEAASLGVPLQQVAMTLRGATAGLDVRDFRDELDVSRKYDLMVKFSPESRTSTRMLDKVKIRSSNGFLVPLSNFTSISQGPGVNAIRHVDRRRVVRISAQNEGRSAVEISDELQKKLGEMELPPGYAFQAGGEYKDTEESFASLKLAYLIAFLLIFTLLVAQFNSFFQPFAIMTALPLSVVGAMVGLLVTNNNFSIMSFVGLVGLTGIVVNDSIVLVDCINRMRRFGMTIFDSVIAAGRQRLRPIISTTVTTIGGIITLTITDELWEGLGVVIIFGIGFATVLTLVVVPVMYTLFEGAGYWVKSALRGPRWLDEPEGRRFHFTRRRYAAIKLMLIVVVQSAVLIAGAWIFLPKLWMIWDDAVLRAPTLLKLVIESLVFGLGLAARVLGVAALLLTPTWIGLLYLMGLRSRDGDYIEITHENLIATTPAERTVIPLDAIEDVKRTRASRGLIVRAGGRRLELMLFVDGPGSMEKEPFIRWMTSKAPKRSDIKSGVTALWNELNKVVKNDGSGSS